MSDIRIFIGVVFRRFWLRGLCSLPLLAKVDILPAEVRGMLVQPSVFKTDVGREKRLGGVRFPCISAMIVLMDEESHLPGSTLLVLHRIRYLVEYSGRLCSTVWTQLCGKPIWRMPSSIISKYSRVGWVGSGV